MASFQKYTTKEGVRWLYKYYGELDPETGKKKQSTKRGFKTKREAQLDAAKTEQEVADGTFVSQDKTSTFEQVYEQWYETNSPNFKPSTKKAVRSKFKKQLIPHFGALKMKDITRSYCQDVINKMAQQIKTVDNMKMYANQIFEHAIKMDIRQTNPMKGVIIPKRASEHMADNSDDQELNFLDKKEIRTFLDIAKKEFSLRDYVMFHMLIYTGARKGEISALRWSDIDFKSKMLNLNKTLFQADGAFMSLTSKTRASRRTISLDDTTIALLKKFNTEQKKRQLAALEPSHTDMLFTREDGTPIRLAYLNDRLDDLIRKHNLKPVTVHGLRHTHASLLFEAGASIKEVQERLGHSDIKMTMNIYTHVTKAVKEQTAARFDSFMKL